MDGLERFHSEWKAFCDGDAFNGKETFADKMEAEGLIELVDVDDEALDDFFAVERGIEKGGKMWKLTAHGRAVYDKYNSPTPTIEGGE